MYVFQNRIQISSIYLQIWKKYRSRSIYKRLDKNLQEEVKIFKSNLIKI